MKISTKSRYGVRACIYLAEKYSEGVSISLTEIAANTGLSATYLEQLLLPLRKSEIVGAVRGAMGGYFLKRAPSEITIGQIMRSLEDGLELVSCINGECSSKVDCPTYYIWAKLQNSIDAVLDSVTLQTCLTQNNNQ